MTPKQREKELIKQKCVTALVFEVIGVIFLLYYSAFSYDHPTYETGDLIQGTMSIMTQNPTYFLPVAWSIFLPYTFALTAIVLLIMAWSFYTERNFIGDENVASTTKISAAELTQELATPLGEPGHSGRDNFIYGEGLYIAKNSTYTDKKGVRHEGLHSVNSVLVAETGGGKTFRFVKPNILQMNCSYICTDPSGSTQADLGELLYRFGYNVRSIDIETLLNCNQYNPLKYVRDEAGVKKLIQTFMANTKKEGETGQSQDPFWDNAMEAFLCSITSLLIEFGDRSDIMDGKIYNKAMPTLCELTRMATAGLDAKFESDEDYKRFCKESVNEKKGTALGHIFHNIRREYEGMEKPYCLKEWENYKLAPEKTATTILITAAVKLDPFNVQKVVNLTSADTLNLDTFGTKRDMLFIKIPQDVTPYMFLASFVYSQVFEELFHRGNNEMEGSHSIKLQNGEHVRWFKKDVSVEEVQKVIDSYQSVKIVTISSRIDKNDTYYAIVDNEYNEEEAQNQGGYDEIDAYRKYIQYVESHTISRRPTLELAQQYVADLQNAKIVSHHDEANPTTCRFIIDEFANIGEIPNFLKLLATVRKYNIVCDVILQSYDQLKRMYEKNSAELEDNCPVTMFFGGSGSETTKKVSERLGKAQQKVRSVSTDNKKANVSHNTQARDFMDTAEVGRLPMDEEIVMLSHYQPCITKKYDPYQHPMWKYTRGEQKKQKGKENFFVYDITRLPELSEQIPIAMEVQQYADHMVSIQPFSEAALQHALGKTEAALQETFVYNTLDALNRNIESSLSAEPA